MAKRALWLVVVLVGMVIGLTSCERIPAPGQVDEDFQAAINVVLDTVLPAEVPAGATFTCLRMSSSIPAGTIIEPDAPESASNARTMTMVPQAMTVAQESYFFFLDLAPATFYEHDVKYILVGKDGQHTVMGARWWPKVDGKTPRQFQKVDPDKDFIIASHGNLVVSTQKKLIFKLPLLKLLRGEGFIPVQGLMPTENLFNCAQTTYLNGVSFFNAYKGSLSELDGLVQGQADNVLDKMDDMAEDGLSPITIYIIAHGGYNYVRLGGVAVYASDFRTRMQNHPDTLFNFIVGSCHSGTFLNDLNTLANVRVVLAACDDDEGAAPDWDNADGTADHNPADSGSEWTSSLLAAADAIVSDGSMWNGVKTAAASEKVPVTSMLLREASFAALGVGGAPGTFQQLDLTERLGYTNPQTYSSW